MGIQTESAASEGAAFVSLGQQLRAQREQLGMSVAEVGSRLKLSDRIIQRIEADDLVGLTDGVFLRGYLLSYVRLTGLPASLVDEVVRKHSEPVPLIATGTIPRSRHLLDRWSVSATYLILTGLIVGPTLWLAATHGRIEHNLVRTTPLDRPVVALPLTAGTTDNTADPTTPVLDGASDLAAIRSTEPTAVVVPSAPVTASLAPFTSMTAAPAASSPTQTAPANHNMVLTISEPSWIEVLKADGTRLEYGLLPVGVQRSYSSNDSLTVRIGNVAGTQLQVDGDVVDLAALKRGNVAHLRLFGDSAMVARAEP